VSLVYIASVISAIQLTDGIGASWYAFGAFYVAVTAALVVYYRATR
jgi:hypothetical protein